jgi:tRNA-dihydrouridine synthase B
MVASNPALRNHKRTLLKADHSGEPGPRSVQILGTNPRQMADAARYNSHRGAQIIDINMGCPAKKVCSVAAGSALLKNEALVKEILETVIDAVDIPVTLKIRTGWDPGHRNALTIAHIAENSGIAALTIHGRTRRCGFSGQAEYETIRQVKQAVKIPVIANGDIDSPEKAKSVLDFTGADAIMIGRAAQGRPWIFDEINHYLAHQEKLPQCPVNEISSILQNHLEKLYRFYGQKTGVRIARKHIAWYFKNLKPIPTEVKQQINKAEKPVQQTALVGSAFLLINNGF